MGFSFGFWIHKPTHEESRWCGIGQKKFFCGRRNKFALNCRAVSDVVKGKFLEMSMTYMAGPLLTAWFLKAQDCINDWSMVSWLLDGLCLFGDNAYINSLYMAMPYKNVSGGSRNSR